MKDQDKHSLKFAAELCQEYSKSHPNFNHLSTTATSSVGSLEDYPFLISVVNHFEKLLELRDKFSCKIPQAKVTQLYMSMSVKTVGSHVKAEEKILKTQDACDSSVKKNAKRESECQ